MIPAQGNGFRNPQPVPEHHQDKQMIAGDVPTRLGAGEKLIDLSKAQIVPPAFMGVSGYIRITFDISPFRHRFGGSA